MMWPANAIVRRRMRRHMRGFAFVEVPRLEVDRVFIDGVELAVRDVLLSFAVPASLLDRDRFVNKTRAEIARRGGA